MRERVVAPTVISPEDEKINISLRPEKLRDYIGQKQVVEKLSVSLAAARNRNEPHEHILFYGPPGLGKTTLAYIMANEMGTRLVATSGPSLQRSGDLMGILTNLGDGDVLFIDEIHRLSPAVEEFIYPAMEDFKVDFVVDKGAFARVLNVPLKKFTFIGATTRAGLLSAPLRSRFGIFHHIDFYPQDELSQIIERSAALLEIKIDDDACDELSRRARGTPRIANRLLRRVRDFSQVKGHGAIDLEAVNAALDMEGIDSQGLDNLDRKFISTIINYYGGGPVGIEALAATLNEETDTLEEMVEPFLLLIGFLQRTKRGRMVSAQAYKHLNIPVKPGLRLESDNQESLL
jgi:Holliday junction DNA helicase RuvB